MKKLLIVSFALGICAIAVSLTAYSKVFNETYKLNADSTLSKAACAVCHLSPKGGKLNPYGLDIQVKMKEAKTKKITKEILAKVEALDSDKDGVKNIDEIKKGTFPGVK
jgi:hypothetical protein